MRDISEIYNNVLTQIGMFLIILGAIVAVAINAVFWMIRRMLKPLRDLRETAGAISQGQLDRRVRVRSNDEVGALSVSFNQMADQIECQMEELAQVSERRKQLLGSLAHELKTPMTSIIGYSDTLLHVRINEEQQKKALTHINNECRRLERLSGKMMNLLELYNNETIHMEKHPVSQLIGKVAELEKYHLKEQGITLETRSDDTVLLMDMDLMESLLVNLIDNAMKASKEGDTIYVEAAGTCILVEDHGKGIPAEEIPKITEAFYMVDKSRSKKAGGIGLGLALCTQIVKLHGAKMEIKSNPGVGTQFRVIFSEEQYGDKMKKGKKRILLRIVWIGMILMAAGFLTGCMETSEDDCIVKEKETETGDSIRSYSSGTEAVENVSVAEQVQAASPCMLSVEEGKIHVDLQASVYLPQGNSMKIYKAKTRYFTQEDMNGWIHILTQGQPLKNDKGDTISWRAQQELTGMVNMTDPYASWAAAGKKVYQFEMQNLLEDGYKESGVSLRREECEYVPWSRDDSWQILHTKVGRKRMRKEADALLQTLGLAEEFHFMQSRAVYCTEDSVNENTGEETETGDTGASEQKMGWRFYYTRQVDEARINQSTDHSLSGDILFGLGGNLDMASPENEGEGYDGTGSGTENWKPSREAESFYITFDDEGLAEVTWINPCIVEENEGGGVFLLPFSDILQVFQKSITKQYILEMLSGNGLEVSATIQTIRLGYRRIETEDKDGKKKKEQIIPVWDFIGTYSSPQTEQLLADADDLWVQCYLRQERTDSLLTINANDGAIVDWGNEL